MIDTTSYIINKLELINQKLDIIRESQGRNFELIHDLFLELKEIKNINEININKEES